MDFRKNGGKYLVTIEVIILIIVLVLGVLHFIIPDGSKNKTSADGKNNAISGTNSTETPLKYLFISFFEKSSRTKTFNLEKLDKILYVLSNSFFPYGVSEK